jgi:hypothetical protein
MLVEINTLKELVGTIADYAQAKIDNGDVSGPRYGALLKMVWCGTSGEPCYTSCQSLADAMQILREVENCAKLDGLFISLTAKMIEIFPDGGAKLDDFDALRKLSSEIGKVIPLDQIELPTKDSIANKESERARIAMEQEITETEWPKPSSEQVA